MPGHGSGPDQCDFERRFDVGKAFTNSAYVYRPVEKKMEMALDKQKTYFPYAPSREVVTPHFDWYQPNYGGKLRALYLGNFGESREVVELAQVLDWTTPRPASSRAGSPSATRSARKSPGPPDPLEYLKRLPDYVRPGDKYDVIIIRNLSSADFKNIPMEFKTGIVDLVKSGAGLVALAKPSPEWGPLWNMFNEVQQDPELSGGSTARLPEPSIELNRMANLVARTNVVCGQYGTGRVIFDLNNESALLNAQGAPLAELARWAARKDAPVTLDSIQLVAANLTWETWDQQQLRVVVTAGRDLGSATAELSWYSEKPVQEFFKFARNGKPRSPDQPTLEAVATNTIRCEITAGKNSWQWPAALIARRSGAGAPAPAQGRQSPQERGVGFHRGAGRGGGRHSF